MLSWFSTLAALHEIASSPQAYCRAFPGIAKRRAIGIMIHK